MDSRPHDNEAANMEEGLARPAGDTGAAHVDARAVGGEAAATGAPNEPQEAGGAESGAETDEAGDLSVGARKSAAAADSEAAGVWITDNLLPQHVLHLRTSGLDDVTRGRPLDRPRRSFALASHGACLTTGLANCSCCTRSCITFRCRR